MKPEARIRRMRPVENLDGTRGMRARRLSITRRQQRHLKYAEQ